MLTGDDLELFERSVRHATESSSGPALDAALDDLGWHDALGVDRRTAVSLAFEHQGRSAATSSALAAVMASALGLERGTAVVLPRLGTVAAPGSGDAVSGLAIGGVRAAEAVAVATGEGVAVVAGTELTETPVGGLDPGLGLVEVTGARLACAPVQGAAWADAVAAGQLALAHELIGCSRTMLQLARDHAVDRIQFDRPIAQFQAVRHRLAEALVAIEGAHDAAGAAWDEGGPLAAAVAKAIAGRSARTTAKHCQQVLAGVGFTLEHPFHRSYRRALTLDRLLGDSTSLTRSIGEQLLRDGGLPPMLAL